MNKLLFFLFSSVLLISCQENKKEVSDVEVVDSTKMNSDFQMYEMTELALLMEQMYAHNQQIRTRIINQEDLGEFPKSFEKIHTAVMTDPSENDLFFQEQATEFINAQKEIYKNPETAKEKFNEMVESCLACHAKKCGGPVPRIKKLFIR